jgi:superfamily II DNA or RNA helicase
MSGLLTSATAPPPILRHYQVEAVDQIARAFAEGARTPILVLPTGGGKTVVAGEVIRREVERGGTCLFLAPRRELVLQCSAALSQTGVDHGVFMAGREDLENAWAPVTVASIDTAMVRILRAGRRPFPDPGLVICDEAHLSITLRRQALLSLWPDARLLGLTATPSRKDGKALGVIYDRLIEGASVDVLTRMGYLVPARYFSLSEPDLARVETVAGDYNQKQLDQAVNHQNLVADIVETWLDKAGGRRTAVFATSIDHAVALADAFQQVGVAAEHVNAKTSLGERAEIFRRFADGDTQVVTNCFLMSYGFDLPEMSCIVLARPTKSLVMYLQMLGRGLRPAEGKSDCLVLDHSGAVHYHGFAADPRFWTLDGKYALDSPRNMACEAAKERQVDCPECGAVFSGTRICPECGYELKPKGRLVKNLDGELIEIGAGLPEEEIDRHQFHAELRGYVIEKGHKPGWAAHKFLRVEGFSGRIWEPACGRGAISEVLEAHGHTVVSTDLVDRGTPANVSSWL